MKKRKCNVCGRFMKYNKTQVSATNVVNYWTCPCGFSTRDCEKNE